LGAITIGARDRQIEYEIVSALDDFYTNQKDRGMYIEMLNCDKLKEREIRKDELSTLELSKFWSHLRSHPDYGPESKVS